MQLLVYPYTDSGEKYMGTDRFSGENIQTLVIMKGFLNLQRPP